MTSLKRVCVQRVSTNILDAHTPRTKAAPTVPSTRETIDLVSDDESGVVVKKREPSSSPLRKQFARHVQNSVTVRKRSKQPDFQENAPVQPFVKKQRSPSGISV